MLPSAFTLANLFFGFWAIVLVVRGSLEMAAWLVVYAAVADWLDGRLAHLSRTHTRFGAELDSLADMVSFGVAPSLLMYRLFFDSGEWSWLAAFLFAGAVALRLARFNVEQGGRARRHFLGLPSPAAGAAVATYHPFTGSAFFESHLAAWMRPDIVTIGVVALGGLMLSHIPYPVLRPGLRGAPRRLALATMLLSLALIVRSPAAWVFPVLMAYVLFGLARAFVLEVAGQLAGRDPVEEELKEPVDDRPLDWE